MKEDERIEEKQNVKEEEKDNGKIEFERRDIIV